MTIITHRKNLLRKLGVKNTAGLIKYAMQNGLIDEPKIILKGFKPFRSKALKLNPSGLFLFKYF